MNASANNHDSPALLPSATSMVVSLVAGLAVLAFAAKILLLAVIERQMRVAHCSCLFLSSWIHYNRDSGSLLRIIHSLLCLLCLLLRFRSLILCLLCHGLRLLSSSLRRLSIVQCVFHLIFLQQRIRAFLAMMAIAAKISFLTVAQSHMRVSH